MSSETGQAVDATRSEATAAISRKRRADLVAPLLLLLPAVAWSGFFFVWPLTEMLWESFQADGAFSLTHYAELFSTALYVRVLTNTFEIAAIVTIGCLLLGYPVAYFLAMGTNLQRAIALGLVVLPHFLDYIVRSYSWMILLGRNGIVNDLLTSLGLIERPLRLLYTTGAVAIGMIQILMPLMILTLFAVMMRIDRQLFQAAEIHGANRWHVFKNVTFPLSLPGVFGGCLLVFVESLGFYITPALLGGPRDTMIAQIIAEISNDLLDWPLASAVGTLLLVVSTMIVIVYNRFFSLDRLWGEAKT